MSDQLYSVQRAALELNVTPRTIQRWCEIGKLPNAYKLDPQRHHSPYVIPTSDIEAVKRSRVKLNQE